ncbi:hypothetical protein MBAV_000740 [Candidatus Magnetobacterium bavaricum]|uniref:Uncharacterized protein n=1 Tax=Candidatus Magnetobacterium bavaricum TaxID=29290 RepID=A0A0F3GYV6_9BACT|nr:hypothetical protein MBAV_000740 [Candidatus Magnetobacterium bavaricum]
MSKGGVSQVVPQGHGLGEVFVETQGTGNSARNLCNLQDVGQASAVVVPARGKEYLRLVLEAPKRL